MMMYRTAILILVTVLQVACCSQSSSYPVMANVTKIEVADSGNVPIKEIRDDAQVDKVVRFVDERRARWCSPRFGTLPNPNATLNLYINDNGKGIIGFGDRFFIAEFSNGKYKMDISEEEEQEFLKLLGVSKDQIFAK
jgi:hypothetical protein